MLGADPNASDPPAGRPALQRPAELLAAGRPGDAAEALAAVVAATPTYAAAFVLLGVAQDAAGRPAEALVAWHRAAFLVPNSPLVLRERRRLLAATTAEAPAAEAPAAGTLPDDTPAAPSIFDPAVFEAPVEDAPVVEFDIAETPVAETTVEESEVVETSVAWADEAEVRVAHEHDEPSASVEADPDAIETAPLDDFVFADAVPGPGDDDGFDPDAFDFSAFDIGDDEPADWLTDAAPGGPPVSDPDAFDLMEDDEPLSLDPPADLADWAETLDASVRIMPPEARAEDPDAEPADAAAASEAPDEAVFRDVAEAPPSPLDVPVSDSLAPEMPPAQAAWAPDPPAGPTSVADELDSLIASLEDAPRIRPDASFSGSAVRVTEADVDVMASETLARIYAAQHQYVRAAAVYETLAAREPARAEAMLAQAAEMRRRG